MEYRKCTQRKLNVCASQQRRRGKRKTNPSKSRTKKETAQIVKHLQEIGGSVTNYLENNLVSLNKVRSS